MIIMSKASLQSSLLGVFLHRSRIGTLVRLADDHTLLTFDAEYQEGINRPVLSLSFKGEHGGLINPSSRPSVRLPPFFSNLLPEKDTRFREYLAMRAGVNPAREFPLLGALGADLAGAVTVRHIDDKDFPELGSSGESREVSTGSGDEISPVLRFSLAGVQLKFSAIEKASEGLTIPADGMGGSWIVKLPSTVFPAVPQNEFTIMELARAIGIDVPQTQIVALKSIQGLPDVTRLIESEAFAIRRFDRATTGERVHIEDFAQVVGVYPEEKYERVTFSAIAKVLADETTDEDVTEFIRRLVFSIVVGNADMHLKNWSLIYRDFRTPSLSPAYDLVSTIPYPTENRLALTFGKSRSMHEISQRQVQRFSDAARLPFRSTWQTVKNTTDRTAEEWHHLDAKEILPKDIRQAIHDHIHTVAKNVN